MPNYNDNKKYGLKNASSYPKKITEHSKKSPVEDVENEIIGTRPAVSRNFQQLAETYNFHKQSA